MAFALIILNACSSDTVGEENTSTGMFALGTLNSVSLSEGSESGVNIPIVLDRFNGHDKQITLSISAASGEDRLMSFNVTPIQLDGAQSTSTINVRLAIDDIPIMPQQRTFTIIASDGEDSASTQLVIDIQPVDAPDVYLLVGQSNMVGFSGDGTKLADVGGPDEPNPRILQLNVTKNDQFDIFNTNAAYTAPFTNVIESNRIVRAEDPLHIPLDPNNTSGKDLSYIGLGMSFAKTALNGTTNNIVLVPAAWSGSAFCDNDNGPAGQWNSQAQPGTEFTNTLLFDRAVTRTNIALAETSGILRGILWHQGESDSNDRCAADYLANLERLAQQLRLNINADRRGGDLRRADANIPFVLGTMSRGEDERGDLSEFYFEKQIIDDAHKTLPSKISHAAVVINDDLTPANGYPCGNSTCIHYGARALREMGSRYYDALRRAIVSP